MSHLQGQVNTVGTVLQNLVQTQNASNDEQFYERLGHQLGNGEIDQATFTRKIAERAVQRDVAQRMIAPPQAQAPAPAPQQADPNAEVRRAQQIGARAIVQGLGLQGNEPGLDYTSPQSLVQSGQRILAQRQGQPQSPESNSLNVNDAMGELARQQGYVIPHRDGGRPTGVHPTATEADLDAIVWDKANAHNPKRRVEELRKVRSSMAARTPSVRTGDGLLGNPNSFSGR